MSYITDLEEASSTIGRPLDGPVYKGVWVDDDGCEVAVPVFKVWQKNKKKGWGGVLASVAVALVMSLLWALVLMAGLVAKASGPGYEDIDQTEDTDVIALTEAVAEIYQVCPELLQAIVFYESSNQRTVASSYGDIGYMQINPRWHQARMDRLGITDLTDGYSNILVGADLLCELFTEYEDPALVLMCYNVGTDKAVRLYDAGRISDYAKNVLELSEQLERLHEK